MRTATIGLLGVSLGFFVADAPLEPPMSDPTQPLAAEERPSPELQAALNRWLNVEFHDMPIPEFASRLATQAGVNIVVDPTVLSKTDAKPELRVNARLQRVRLLSVLEVALRPFDLGVDVRPDYLMIVDRQSLNKVQVQWAYPMPDLVIDHTRRWIDPGGVMHVQLVSDLVDRDLWECNGGEATIQFHTPSISLVVNAPKATQKRVAAFIDLLRRSREQTKALLAQRELGKIEQLLLDLDRFNNSQLQLQTPPELEPSPTLKTKKIDDEAPNR